MKTNIGSFDGALRIAVFLALVVNAVFQGTLLAWLMIIPGAVLFATAAMTWCAVYEAFGINTAKTY